MGARYLTPLSSRRSTLKQATDVAFRVIADHIRTLSFAIADGIDHRATPIATMSCGVFCGGRFVMAERSVLHEPFFYKLVAVLARTMGDVFPEIRGKQQHVADVLRREEEAFNKTLDRGIEEFNLALKVTTPRKESSSGLRARERVVSGDIAFELYDTYGFPLDLTELMARERGMSVDVAGFEKLMEEQRARARRAQKREVISFPKRTFRSKRRKFLGYDFLETEAVVEVVAPTARALNSTSSLTARRAMRRWAARWATLAWSMCPDRTGRRLGACR